jgi:DNA-binding PadR family transcriptional regulator
MPLPTLTALQAAILDSAGSRETAGQEIREYLKKNHGFRISGPAFYQAMARLEEAGFVQGQYKSEVIEGQIIKRRVYRLTGQGECALDETIGFYQSLQSQAGGAAHV